MLSSYQVKKFTQITLPSYPDLTLEFFNTLSYEMTYQLIYFHLLNRDLIPALIEAKDYFGFSQDDIFPFDMTLVDYLDLWFKLIDFQYKIVLWIKPLCFNTLFLVSFTVSSLNTSLLEREVMLLY